MKRIVRLLFIAVMSPFKGAFHLVLSPVYAVWSVLALYGWAFEKSTTLKQSFMDVKEAVFAPSCDY